jgi:Flp pilus assembly protein TadD
VLAIDANYEPALFNLAILEKAKGSNAEALSLYERAVAASPKDASAHLNLGLLLREMGQKALGDSEVRTAIRLNPKLRDPAKTPAPTKSASASSSPSPSGS